jgi:hypothetical protein
LTYDSSRHRVVLFGGYGGGEKAETWEYDGTNWVKINPVHSPSSRQDGAITFDSARNRVVFFGGYHTGTGGMNDTWEYDGVDWSQIVTANAPSTRYYTGMTFDSVRNKVVLFGGLGAGTTRYNDTWEYNGTNWTQLSIATSPAARETWQNMVFDNLKGRVVLFGGRDANSAMLNDTWEFNGIDWIQRNYVGKPSARFTFGITYDTTSSKTILFGGLNGGALGETWEGKDVFDTPKTAQSLKLNVTTGVITGATITKTDNPNGQSVSYYLTADGGSHWEGPVNAGNEWIFANPGNDLRWKIDLSTNNPAATPVVSDLTIDYRIDPATDSITLDTAAPTAFSLTTPADNTWFGNASPTLNWNASTDPSGIAYYQLYVDGTLNRDNIAGLSTSPSSPLAEGMHTWYIRAVDAAGNGTNSTQTLHAGYDASTPAAPSTFTATGGTDTITLNWSFSNNTGSPIEKVIVERIDWTAYDPAHPTDPWNSYLSYKYKEYDGGTTSAVYSVSDVDPDTKIAQGRRYAYRIAGKDSINSAYGTYSTVRSGLTEDSIFDVILGNVSVAPCDGVSNCSTKPSIGHKGFEIKITWDPAVDTGVGTTHYLVYRSETDLNSGNYGDATVRNSYQIVGVLPYTSGAQQPVWYDNDANNDATTTFYDATGGTITISPEIQALTSKTVASPRLDDYHLYYYRVVGVDANNNKSPVFAESVTPDAFEVLKAHRNGNSGLDAERTPDVTAESRASRHPARGAGTQTPGPRPQGRRAPSVSGR